jgi:DNA-directed RNA polymerase III subunit RPC1
MTPYIERYG